MSGAGVTILALKSFLGVLLVAAGSAKLADRGGFALTLTGLGLGGRASRLATWVVSIAELTVGSASLSAISPSIVNLAVLVLMLLFSCVSVVAVLRSPDLSCRCFGSLTASRFNGIAVIRSLSLSAMAAVVLWGFRATREVASSGAGTTLLTIFAALVFAVICFQATTSLETVRRSSS